MVVFHLSAGTVGVMHFDHSTRFYVSTHHPKAPGLRDGDIWVCVDEADDGTRPRPARIWNGVLRAWETFTHRRAIEAGEGTEYIYVQEHPEGKGREVRPPERFANLRRWVDRWSRS